MSARRGWCPDIHGPMLSGDGWLARIKPPHSRLTAGMAQAIADAAARYGNGVIELTSRANLQIRGLRADTLRDFARAMIDCGVAGADAGLERRRNLMVSPLADSDPAVHPSTLSVADAIVAWMKRAPARALPAKYGFVVDGGGSRPLRGVRGDVVLRLGPPGAPAAAVGFVRYGDAAIGSLGLAPVFGQTTAQDWHRLAQLAAHHGDGTVGIAPARSVLIAGVRADTAKALAHAAAAIGFVADASDPRLRIAACPGAPACASGLQPARRDAAALVNLPDEARVHVLGCAKGCAHPQPAELTFVGTADGYALIRNGRASDPPVARGLRLADCLAALRAA